MGLFKRIFLFLIVNLLVVLSISFLLSIFNVQPYLNAYGIDLKNLAIFCLLWGFLGSFISLFMSKAMAKWLMRVKIIDETTQDLSYQFIIDKVKDLSLKADLSHTPEIGVYNSKEINAFATGPTQKRSLIAVSSALIDRMQNEEIEAILAHEISHIKNGDMVTMTLLQGIVNSFVMFLSRVLAFVITSNRNRNSRSSYMGTRALIFLFQIVFMIFGSMLIATYSRRREFRADEGSANLSGKDKMIKALEALKQTSDIRDVLSEKPAFQSLKISSPTKKGLIHLFASHPPLDERIKRLNDL